MVCRSQDHIHDYMLFKIATNTVTVFSYRDQEKGEHIAVIIACLILYQNIFFLFVGWLSAPVPR